MSVIRKYPFIQSVMSDLTDAQKESLLSVINGSGTLVNASFSNMPVGVVTPVLFQFDATNSKTGILIQSSHYKVLIAYHRFQDLLMFKINSNHTYEKINEYLDINELRRVLDVGEVKVTAGEIDSGDTTAGKVLAADGDGGAEWENVMDVITPETVESGDAVKLFGFNSQGELVKDDVPEGILVDETIIEDSSNAVAGGAVYDALANINEDLETKANVDGNYPTLTAGLADNLTPYSEDSGDTQDNPFISQGTGTNNNNEIVTVGDYGLLKEKQGHTLVVNQLVQNGNFASSSGWQTYQSTASINSNVMTVSYSSGDGYWGIFNSTVGKLNTAHKYLLKFKVKLNSATSSKIICALSGGTQVVVSTPTNNVWTEVSYIFSDNIGSTNIFTIFAGDSGTSGDTFEIQNVQVIDLTQMFNGDIPQDLLDHPEHFSWYYNGSLAYNTGTLVNANSERLVSTGRNQFDKSTATTGKYIGSDGSIQNYSTLSYSDYIKVVPNEIYYVKETSASSASAVICAYDKDKNFVGTITSYSGNVNLRQIPANVEFIIVNTLLAKLDEQVVSLYYTPEQGGEGYTENYPYEAPYVVDTGDEVLRQAGNVKDYKTPDGTIHRLVGNRAYQSGDENDSSLTTDGTTTNYPLETPTTEQGTTFSENLPINDYGMLYWQESNGVPQGAEIFYPVNYKGFLDDVYNRTSGDAQELVVQSDLSASETARDTVDNQLIANIGGMLRHVLAEKASIDFEDTAYVDLGTLSWIYGGGRHQATLANAGSSGNSVAINALCSIYSTTDWNDGTTNLPNMSILGTSDGSTIAVINTTYTDATAFKAAMKGILLAYEKASS